MIKTVNDNQHEIIRNIIELFIPDGIEVDPTYSKGVFYKPDDIQEPKLKFDLHPVTEDTVQATANNLPLDDESVQSVMFDPPFLAGFTKKDKYTGIMGVRFKGFANTPEMWGWYDDCLVEFYRILKNKGILVFKCQDSVNNHLNWFSHCYVMNRAIECGFYPKDMFVLTAKHRLKAGMWKNQEHARKHHCYFWVFQKIKCKVDYKMRG